MIDPVNDAYTSRPDTFYCASTIQVFVYGTLKPGEVNYVRYCQGKVKQAQPAIAQGMLYSLPVGYPALSLGQGWVKGYLLQFSDAGILEDLDKLEGYSPHLPPDQNEYQRQQVPIFTPTYQALGEAWVYWMWFPKIQAMGGILLPEGEWFPGQQCTFHQLP